MGYKGRKKGTYKYASQITGKPIGVYEWRKELRYLKNQNPIEVKKLLDENRSMYKENQLTNLFRELHSILNKFQMILSNNLNKEIVTYENLSNKKIMSLSKKDKVEKIYKITIEEYNQITSKCALCGFNSYAVDLHHLDLDKNNNSSDNLIGLCKNCHSAIHYKKEDYLKRLEHHQNHSITDTTRHLEP